MKITSQQLKSALADPFIQCPPQSSGAVENTPWWIRAKEAVKHGTTVNQWQACQWVALLFETYEEDISTVLVKFHEEKSGTAINMTSMTMTTHINGQYCDGETGIESGLYGSILRIDQGRALDAALAGLDNCAHNYLLGEIRDFVATFNTTEFTSAAQARALAAEIAPDINSWFIHRVLGDVSKGVRQSSVEDQEMATKKKGGAAPKM